MADSRWSVERAFSEGELLAAVRQTALLGKWSYYHTRLSQGSDPGFPDCVMAKGSRLVVAELKNYRNRLSAAQAVWLDAFRAAGCEVYLWRPSHWLSGEIERVLLR